MNVAQQCAMQEYLMEAQAKFTKELAAVGLPTHLCLHLAPDMCWISEEHEYQKEDIVDLPNGIHEQGVICNRKPPACHIVLVKL